MDDDPVPILTNRRMREAAVEGDALARASSRGDLVRLRRGAYAEAGALLGIDPRSRHLALVRAARLAAAAEPVFSHESAGAMHGIPSLEGWPDAVHTTVPPGRGGPTQAVMRTQRAIAEQDVVAADDGTRMTSLARTAVDLAASRSLLGGIIAMSHARASGVTEEELAAALDRAGPITGIRLARLALARSVPGTESVLETLVVVRCQDLGFAAPELQRIVRGDDGRDYRVDFAWLDGRVLGEADGRAKYERPELRGTRAPADVLWAEKRREDAIRASCDRFVRLSWEDAWRGAPLASRLDAAGVPRDGRRLHSLTF